MNREFAYNEENGWSWHKSWNLPEITVTFSVSPLYDG